MELAEHFAGCWPGGAAVTPELEAALVEVCGRAEAAFPDVRCPRPTFVERLARRPPPGVDPARHVATVRAADLYLAAAAAAGDAAAVGLVERMLSAEVDAARAALRAAPSLTDEVKQRLRAHLLAGGEDRGPAIGDYAGHGDLRGFLRISATREHLRLLRAERREVALDDDVAAAVDPELERLKATYRDHFTRCFLQALGELAPRERTLLRHHTIDRLSIDQIGALYGAHRATAARWLERARGKLAERTEELLAEHLSLDSVEVASVIRLVRSQLHVTLERVLADDQR
jgi:RNA polymerase sigma-70 factor, ECF subfamily